MFKKAILLMMLFSFSGCQLNSGEEYLSFQNVKLMDGDILIDPRLTLKVDPSKMHGAIYIYINQNKNSVAQCKIEAKILSQNMNLEKSQLTCDTDDTSCFFNTGDHQERPRMVLRIRDGSINDIELEVVLLGKPHNEGENCVPDLYQLTLKSEIKKVNQWKKVFSR